VDANGQATFDLYLRHQGAQSDSYILSAHADATRAPLPADWSVEFRDAVTNTVITNSGILSSGEFRHIKAIVQLPSDPPPGTTSVFFAATSNATGASDIKHDAVRVEQDSSLQLVPQLSSQITPGGSVSYRHVLQNAGNALVPNIVLSSANQMANWSSDVYIDSDGDGVLSANDQLVAGPISLSPGDSVVLFQQVTAPGNAPELLQNVSTLTATWASNTRFVNVADTTTVTLSSVTIQKQQAIDTGCDGVPDPGTDFSSTNLDEIEPGNNCILYRLIASNVGSSPSYNVKIDDQTPLHTHYAQSAVCNRTPCWLTEPAVGQTGAIRAETDQLLPGDEFVLEFSVRVE